MSWKATVVGQFGRKRHEGRYTSTFLSKIPSDAGVHAPKRARYQRTTISGLRIFSASGTWGPDKQQSIDVAHGHLLRRLAPKCIELMSKEDLACNAARDRESDRQVPDQSAEIAQWTDYQTIRRRPSANLSFR